MSKTMIPYVVRKRDANKNVLSKKVMSHGTYRCKRHPNSKRCKIMKETITTSEEVFELVNGLTLNQKNRPFFRFNR